MFYYKKVKCDRWADGPTEGRTDGRTDGPTKRGVESRARDLKLFTTTHTIKVVPNNLSRPNSCQQGDS